ncbi:MAG: cytidine deaminase [Atribacterota bacterium]
MAGRRMLRIELIDKVKKRVRVSRQTLQDVAMLVFQSENVSPEGILSVGFLDKEEIRAIKRQFFHQDVDTDVVAFPYGEKEGDKIWGEILICVPVAFEQAQEQGYRVGEEILLLFIHGLLHLLGYQDSTEEESKEMAKRAQELLNLTREWQLRKSLVKKAWEAKAYAYAPYSHFGVGAALLGDGGKIFTGCNVENSSFGLTICAERVALVKAVSSGAQHFQKIAIVSDASTFCLPCGACRQVLFEFAPALEIISATSSLDFQVFHLDELLPYGFRLHGGGMP